MVYLCLVRFLPTLIDPLRLKLFISDCPPIYAYLMSGGVRLGTLFISKVWIFLTRIQS